MMAICARCHKDIAIEVKAASMRLNNWRKRLYAFGREQNVASKSSANLTVQKQLDKGRHR